MRVMPKTLLVALLCVCCIATQAQAQQRIVGGSNADIADYPYQAIVLNNGSFCGGSIRDATHVITAAHCVLDDSSPYPQVASPGAGLFVAYGTDDISAGFDNTAAVASVAVDKRYLRRLVGSEYDSAILTLTSPGIDLDDPAAPADPIVPAAFTPGGSATATGFGSLNEGGAISDTLRFVDVPFVSDTTCAPSYGSEFVASAMVCAGAKDKDTCQGDSGGPLATGAGANLRLTGITSFGTGCGRDTFPGVYTEVSEPTTHAFVTSNPPNPPDVGAAEPVVAGTPQVGETVTCVPPNVDGATPTQYFFYSFDGANFSLLKSGGSATLTVPQSALGQRLNCDARYENDGGFAYAVSSQLSGFVAAAPAAPTVLSPRPPVAPDRTRPTSRITRVRCSGPSCAVSITASDPSPGFVRSLRVTLRSRPIVCARRLGRRTCRRKLVVRTLRAGSLGGNQFRVVVFGLKPRRYRITVVATDSASNRQAKAATRLFTVKRRR